MMADIEKLRDDLNAYFQEPEYEVNWDDMPLHDAEKHNSLLYLGDERVEGLAEFTSKIGAEVEPKVKATSSGTGQAPEEQMGPDSSPKA